VNFAPKGSDARNTIRWRLNAQGKPVYFEFLELETQRASTFEYRALRELQACVSTASSIYWPELVQASLLSSSITQGYVCGKGSKGSKGGGSAKGGAKAEKVEVLRHIWSQPRLIFLHYYLSYLSQV
jgi:hypothetical protein